MLTMKKIIVHIGILAIIILSSFHLGDCQVKLQFGTKSDTIFKKKYLYSSLEVLGFDLLLNRFNYHIAGLEWANVNPSTWKNNINFGFYTDGDAFSTNWLGHPIQGSLAFNSARSNNLGFYRSLPFVIGSNLLWEYFAETEPPSIIDLYTTSFGGIYLGEVTHRLSDLAWNHPYPHKNYIARQVIGSLINPIGAINRYAFGRRLPVTPSSFTPLRMSFNTAFVQRINYLKNYNQGLIVELDLLYGNQTIKEEGTIPPFDDFKLDLWLFQPIGKNYRVPFFNLQSEAIMTGRSIKISPHTDLLFSLNQNYDFINNDQFKLSSFALSGNAGLTRDAGSVKWTLSSKLGFIVLGASRSEFVSPVNPEMFPRFNRDYLYGQGMLIEGRSALDLQKIGLLDMSFRRFSIYSKENPTGWKAINLYSGAYEFPLFNNVRFKTRFNRYRSVSDFLGTQERIADTDIFNELLFSFMIRF